ncbi:MAG: hypothetical protein WEC15_03575, partial [Flavobacteriales bacterium]
MKQTFTLLLALALGVHAHAQSTCATPITITAGTYTVAQVNGMEVPTPICADNGADGTSAGMWYSYTPSESIAV